MVGSRELPADDSAGLLRQSSDAQAVLDQGPFFHGTKADLRVEDLLTAGFRSNYRPEVVMNHIYFTAQPDGAGLAAELAAGEGVRACTPWSQWGPSRTTRT